MNSQSPSQGGGAAAPGDPQGDKGGAGLKCPECGVKFESQEDLESHVQADHPEVGPESSAAGKKSEALPAPKVRRRGGGGGAAAAAAGAIPQPDRHQSCCCCL